MHHQCQNLQSELYYNVRFEFFTFPCFFFKLAFKLLLNILSRFKTLGYDESLIQILRQKLFYHFWHRANNLVLNTFKSNFIVILVAFLTLPNNQSNLIWINFDFQISAVEFELCENYQRNNIILNTFYPEYHLRLIRQVKWYLEKCFN